MIDVTIDRSKYIGGSDAVRIYKGDWRSLWEEKTGRSEAADLSEVFPVQLGKTTEALHLRWLRDVQGHDIAGAGDSGDPLIYIKDEYRRCHLDGKHLTKRQIVETKHTNAFTDLESQAVLYMAQIQHNIYVADADECLFSCIFGNSEPQHVLIGRNDLFLQELLALEDQFWEHVTSDTEPAQEPDISPVKASDFVFDNLITYDWTGNNEWASHASDFVECIDQSKTFEAAKKALKAMVPDDALSVTGHGVTIKRSKNGSLRIGVS